MGGPGKEGIFLLCPVHLSGQCVQAHETKMYLLFPRIVPLGANQNGDRLWLTAQLLIGQR